MLFFVARSKKLSPEVQEMLRFGEFVFLEGLKKFEWCQEHNKDYPYKRSKLIGEKRLAVIHITHGTELLFKAVLRKNGYYIREFKRSYPVKEGKNIEDVLSNRTINFSDAVSHFKRKHPKINFDGIVDLQYIRNEIQHRGTKITKKRKSLFIGASKAMIALYEEEFPQKRSFPKKLLEHLNKI